MRTQGKYEVFIHRESFTCVEKYRSRIDAQQVKPGRHLSKALEGVNLETIDTATFLELVINTKFPQIFAESGVKGDGTDWNHTELSILGDVGMAVPVTVYDDGRHYNPVVHDTPFAATLLFVPGALLP